MGEKNILIIIKSTPYTTINNYEALRTAIGLWDHSIKLLWTGDAVYSLLLESDHTQTKHFLRDLPDLDIEPYVQQSSLVARGIESNVLEEVTALNDETINEILEEADVTLVF